MKQTPPRLLLHPTDPSCWWRSPDPLIASLERAGVLGEAVPHRPVPSYHTGSRFLAFFCFLGCSPSIALAGAGPKTEGGGCSLHGELVHFRFPPSSEKVELLRDRHTRAPRCPRCRSLVSGWRQAIDVWQAEPSRYAWQCPGCGTSQPLHALDWRHAAAFARSWIELWGIHAGEAVPDESLLRLLQESTGAHFDYCYLSC